MWIQSTYGVLLFSKWKHLENSWISFFFFPVMLYYENLAVSIDPFNLHWEPQKKKSSWYMLAIWEDIHAIDCFFLFTKCMLYWRISRLPWWLSGKESTCQCWRHGFDPWSRRIPPAMGQLSLCATTTEPMLYSPCSATRGAAAMRSPHTATKE